MADESDDEEVDLLEDESDELEKLYLSIMVEPQFINFPKRRFEIKIDSYMPATFGIKFRFQVTRRHEKTTSQCLATA